MKCHVTTFRIRTGLGVQSITGVVDKLGQPFVPEHIFMVNGSSALETIYSMVPVGGNNTNASSANTNTHNVLTNESGYSGEADALLFGSKVASIGLGNGPNAGICFLNAQAAFGGNVYKTAKIKSVYSGGFDIEVTKEDYTFYDPTDIMVLILGSDSNDLKIEWLAIPSGSNIHPTTFAAKGLINPKTAKPGSTGSVNAGAVGGWGWGWDSPNGGPMSAHRDIQGGIGGNHKYQSYISYDNNITQSPVAAVDEQHVITWNPTNVVLSGPPQTAHFGYLIGGTNIITSSGSFIQQAGTGQQFVNLRVNAVALFLISVGAPPSLVLQSNNAEICFGWTDGIHQSSFWTGENSMATPLEGAVYLSNTSLLRFAPEGAEGPDTVFTTIAKLVEINEDGTLKIDWTLNDGVGREILWFAIGIAPTPTPSGLYFINTDKMSQNDSYYGGLEKKIPNPTVRTALIGE